ncbi:MAG: hypothetical protein JWP18_2328, partial [Solirubrobacterales bacterium]|nr:hypothetical protein [Solirubrobacterales bacterium]
ADLVLAEETRELLAACEAAAAGGPQWEEAPPRPMDLAARGDVHRDARLRTAKLLAALQEGARSASDEVERARARAQLRDLYGLLARHAGRRSPWQSVFQVQQPEETS